MPSTLTKLRVSNRWSSQELAKRAGLSLSAVRKVERLQHLPTELTVAKLADALGVEFGYLLQAIHSEFNGQVLNKNE